MMTMNIKYQLVPPINHRTNNSERAIQKFKNHFIAGLCIIDKNFHLQLWDRLLHQATISINMLRQLKTLPHISAYTNISREFYFNRTPLSPTSIRLVIHNILNDCTSWAKHGEDGCYIGPEMEHYRRQKPCIPKTRAEKISDTV